MAKYKKLDKLWKNKGEIYSLLYPWSNLIVEWFRIFCWHTTLSKVLLQESLFVCDIWVRNEKKMFFNHCRKSTFQWEPFFVGCQLEIQVSLVLWPLFCCFCPSLVQILREHRPTWKGKSSRSEKKNKFTTLYFEGKLHTTRVYSIFEFQIGQPDQNIYKFDHL